MKRDWIGFAGLLGVFLLTVPVVGSEIMLGPAPYNGWATAGYALNQAAPPEGTYQIAVGQTFRTPDVAEPKVALTGFSALMYGQPYWSGYTPRFRLWDSLDRKALLYEYTGSCYNSSGGAWMPNWTPNTGWLFSGLATDVVQLNKNTMYYWEIENLGGLNWLRPFWGADTSGAAYGNWTEGATYQRFSDGTVTLARVDDSSTWSCDLQFVMAFAAVPEPASLLLMTLGGVLLRRRTLRSVQ